MMEQEAAAVGEQADPQFGWDDVARTMMARRAYRRYHGEHRSSLTLQNWGTVILLLLLWGFYALRAGDLKANLTGSTDGVALPLELEDKNTVEGLIITFVWAYTDADQAFGAFFGFAWILVTTYILVRYQTSLDLKGSAWLTFATCLLMLGLAIDTGLQSEYQKKNILSRQLVMGIWAFIQVLLIVFGVIRKITIPWLATGQRLPPPQLQKSTLQQGAVQDAVEEVWKRAPYIKERMVAEHAAHSTTLFSFSGEYWNWSMLCRGHQTVEKVSYVGGLDSNGAPHGMGAWHDTHKYGELLIGRFMHGRPVPPYRVRTNKGSSFISVRVAVFSCRTDGLRSLGSFTGVWGKYAVNGGQPAPLCAGVATIECNTSGIFYKGFPRVGWLQEPTPLVEGSEAMPVGFAPQESALLVATEPSDVALQMNAEYASAERTTDKREPGWVPQLMREGSGRLTQPMSRWHRQLGASSHMLDAGGARGSEKEGGYDALFFVHGFNCGVENGVALVGQLLALGSFPGDIMPVIFAWPCTGGPFYPFGHVVTNSDYVSGKMIAALENLEADGCRRVHMFGHSMGARVVASAADRLSQFFRKLPSGDPSGAAKNADHPRESMQLASMTFLSPDMDYGEFVGHCGPLLRSLCPLVTIYGDPGDTALDICATSNAYLFKLFPDTAPPGLKEETEKLGIPIASSLGQHCNTCIDSKGDILDVDFVTTTFLSSNVHGLRHNYFHLNREMVDDIRDLMVTGKRAADRPYRLEWTAQNTYGFVVAPNYLVA